MAAGCFLVNDGHYGTSDPMASRVYVKNLYPKGRASLTPKSANLQMDIGNALIAAEANRRAAHEGKTITVTIHDEGHLRVSYTMQYPK